MYFEDGYLLELGLSLRHDERVSRGAMFELKVAEAFCVLGHRAAPGGGILVAVFDTGGPDFNSLPHLQLLHTACFIL